MSHHTLRNWSAVILALAAATAGRAPAHAQPQVRAPASIPGLAPSVAAGDVPAIAWAGTGADNVTRVYVAVPAETPAQRIGPELPGSDGAPSIAASRDGFMLVASRSSASGSRIWFSRWQSGTWSAGGTMPPAAIENHHPDLAASDRAVWVVWVAGASTLHHETLYASNWNGSRWSRPEPLPVVVGTPMAPAIAVDHRGRPAVVWAASDGHDAEVWFTRRARDGWSDPLALSDNELPDILPHIGFVGSEAVVAWSSSTGQGYLPMVAWSRRPGRAWSQPRALSSRPGSSPKVFAARTGPGVVWASPQAGLGAYSSVLRASVRSSVGWSNVIELAVTADARIDVSAPNEPGAMVLGWSAPGEPSAVSARERGARGRRHRGFALRSLAGPKPIAPEQLRSADAISLPGTYLGFGDSITQGTVRFDGVVSFVDPYTIRLAELISGLVGSKVTVSERGAGGELTSEGVGRLRGLMAASPAQFVFLMEGTNDISHLIDPEIVAGNLGTMISIVKTAGRVPVITSLMPRTNGNFIGGLNPRIRAVNEFLLPKARARKAVHIDQYAAFFRQPTLYSDKLHPNAAGYVHMGDVWFRGIQPILQKLLEDQDTERDRSKDGDLFSDSTSPAQRVIQ